MKPEPARGTDSTEETHSPATVVVASSDDYLIGPADVLEIRVQDAPELSGTFVVSGTGYIPMPYLGDILVRDKSPQALSKLIGDGLRGDYLKSPRVTVLVSQYNSRSFFIQGEVRQPGVYRITGKVSLFKLITVAGGLKDDHGASAFIIREVRSPVGAVAKEEAEKYDLKQVNINSIYRGDFESNVMVEPGDVINIPLADVFFIGGEVTKPGSFPLREGTTVRQAVTLAQGTTFQAAKERGVIVREDAKGRRQDIKVDIGAIMAGKQEDVRIQANDILIVPNSRMKSISSTFLKALGMATVQRGVIF
jgi:polysaccharide export outer membrane protein